MAGDMTLRKCVAVWALYVVAIGPLHAEVLADPTRPPAAVGAEGSVAAAGSMGLTSVFLPKKGRAAAVIDGQLVEIGGLVRDARLVKVSETSAVLEGESGIERLFLTPDVEKKLNVTKAAARRKKE